MEKAQPSQSTLTICVSLTNNSRLTTLLPTLLESEHFSDATSMELDLGLDTSEPSVLEWARAQGVCVNYETELLHIRHLQSPSDDEFDRHLHEPSDATIDTAVSGLVKEKLTVNKDTALLLKAAHTLQDELASDLMVTNNRRWRRDLRQELPVLRSDHELDLLNFGDTAVPDFKNSQIPSEITVEENDEGFGWPTRYLDYPAQCDARVKAEKLAISREVLVYLQDTIRDAYAPEDGQRLEAESLIRKQVCGSVVHVRLLTDSEAHYSACDAAFTPSIAATDTIHSILTHKSSAIRFRYCRLGHY